MKHIKWQWIAKGIAFGLLMFFVFTGLTMWLWNNLATPIFGLPALTFLQTVGLMVLGRLLTGGFRPGGWRGGGFGGRMRGRYMRERWQNMSEEERGQYLKRWGRQRCGPLGKSEQETQNPAT
ncbi:MAG: hypothetical protein IPJ82_11895 [Lewinellaceae bacterium]|nr:hypothetical protein [Lewinellaceae bacterium]